MKINFTQNFSQSGDSLVRHCGYGQIRDFKSGEISYVRRLRSEFYPRFHLYVNSEKPLVLNLHLDQKKASYEGYTAHSGDYDSDLVRQEAQRVYNQIIVEGKDGKEELEELEERGSFFSRLFGKK